MIPRFAEKSFGAYVHRKRSELINPPRPTG
jgi:hypothetical protein